jgi:hypothetical protein
VALYARARGCCEHCHRVVSFESFQLAHRAPQTKQNLKVWGPAVIHHPRNLVVVCGPGCNDAVLLAGQPMELLRLLQSIQAEVDERPDRRLP